MTNLSAACDLVDCVAGGGSKCAAESLPSSAVMSSDGRLVRKVLFSSEELDRGYISTASFSFFAFIAVYCVDESVARKGIGASKKAQARDDGADRKAGVAPTGAKVQWAKTWYVQTSLRCSRWILSVFKLVRWPVCKTRKDRRKLLDYATRSS